MNETTADLWAQLRQAAELVITAQFPSEHFLQRRLNVGYARAGMLLDELQRHGIVGPPRGVQQREMRVPVSDLEYALSALDRAATS